MKMLMAYSSKTGNTKKLCSSVHERLKDSFDITLSEMKNVNDYEKYDFIILGFWVDKGTANYEAKKCIRNIKNKHLLLLGTLGASPDSEHAAKCIRQVGELVDASNEYYGAFLARGKVSEKLTKAIKFLPLPKNIRDQMYESSVNSREPNETEITNAAEFVKTSIEKSGVL